MFVARPDRHGLYRVKCLFKLAHRMSEETLMNAKLFEGAIVSNHQVALNFMGDIPESQIVVIIIL